MSVGVATEMVTDDYVGHELCTWEDCEIGIWRQKNIVPYLMILAKNSEFTLNVEMSFLKIMN